MQDLRLIGVHEDGAHLLLAAEDGARFRVPLDEALRAAARRDRPRLGQLQIEIEGGVRPREVQAMIRSGLSPAEVAERSGWTLDKIAKYQGPVLAEREYVAGLARAVRLRHRGSGSGSAPTLEARVTERLGTRGVVPEHLEWDSWRREGPDWTVAVAFPAGGRQREATWSFDVPTRTLLPRDDEARWLSEDETPPAAAPVLRETPVYDVEADGGVDAPRSRPATEGPVDLVTAMRERSAARSRRSPGRRRLEPVALPLDEPEPEPTAAQAPADPVGDAAEAVTPVRPVQQVRPITPPAPTEPRAEDPAADEAEADADNDATTDAEAEADLEADVAADTPRPAAAASDRHTSSARPRRSGRPSVPSWDDIVFGATSRPTRDEAED